MPDAREQVANWMILQGMATGHGDTLQDLLSEIVAHERNRVIRILDDMPAGLAWGDVANAIDAIRNPQQ